MEDQRWPNDSLVKIREPNRVETVALILEFLADDSTYKVQVMQSQTGEETVRTVSSHILAPYTAPLVKDTTDCNVDWSDLPTVSDFAGGQDPGLIEARSLRRKRDQTEESYATEERRRNKNAAIAALEIASEKLLISDSANDSKYELGCVRAGMERVQLDNSDNPIKRFVSFVSGYAAAYGRGLTKTEYRMWLADERYWQHTIDAAETAVKGEKIPLLFILVSKCAADDYAANFLSDERGNVRLHRRTLNDICAELERRHPDRHIILIDVPARLFGCSRSEPTSTGYPACETCTDAGRKILDHMLRVVMTTAVSCGIAVGGIATICYDVTEDWLNDLVNGPGACSPPSLLDNAVANYELQRMKWADAVPGKVSVGRGLHYVFMHIVGDPEAAIMCKKLTAYALGIFKDDRDLVIGTENANVLVKLAFMLHNLMGAKARRNLIKTLIEEKLKELEKDPPDYSEMASNLAKIDIPDGLIIDLT